MTKKSKSKSKISESDLLDPFDPEEDPEVESEPSAEAEAAAASEDMARPEVSAPEPVQTPEPERPVEQLPRIRLEVFARVSGLKQDQMAGFAHWARARKFGPMTVPEWRGALHEFQNKPTR